MVSQLWENLFRPERRGKGLLSLLAENHVFKRLSQSELKFVSELVHLRNYHATELVFRQGEVGVGLYMIMKGSVDVLIEDPLSAGGPTEQVISVLKTGDFFGELALIEDSNQRSASVRAREETVLVGFFKPDLSEVVERNPSLGAKILLSLGEVISRRLGETTARMMDYKKELRKYQPDENIELRSDINRYTYSP